jgi:hypothetical protein
MFKRLLNRFRKPEDPKIAAEKERAKREARQAAIRSESDAARHRNYAGLP